MQYNEFSALSDRFRGFYPVVIDVETAGFNSKTDALLEIAAITLKMNADGWLSIDRTFHFHIQPFEGSILNADALAFNGIDPNNPLRNAVDEQTALEEIFGQIRHGIKDSDCSRAVMVAHNANFDFSFVMAAAERTKIKKNPFHPFATFDTAALSALVYGHTVLAKACQLAGIGFDNSQAHSALYDTTQTALLFCEIVNKWKRLGGWPLEISTK